MKVPFTFGQDCLYFQMKRNYEELSSAPTRLQSTARTTLLLASVSRISFPSLISLSFFEFSANFLMMAAKNVNKMCFDKESNGRSIYMYLKSIKEDITV